MVNRKNARALKQTRLSTIFALAIVIILGIQLLAAVAWSADSAHAGPGVTIVQLSQDEDSRWAVEDLKTRLSEFITDDPFFPDRIMVEKTSDPCVAESINDRIIIYVSHGGPLGIVTGRHLTSWSRMAQIIENSYASIHLFAACSSKNIIRHGSDDSTKKLYTVPGARPAEVTNVEIATTVMLAFGLDSDDVSEYRTSELTHAKELIQSGESVHIMDFEQIILNEIENIDGNYSDTYTSDFKVYREAVELTYSQPVNISDLPSDLTDEILYYYRSFIDSDGVDAVRNLEDLLIVYTKNYYINSTYYAEEGGESQSKPLFDSKIEQDDAFSEFYTTAMMMSGGYWVNSTPAFTGGTYSGWIIYAGDNHEYLEVVVNVTASGPTLDANNKTVVDSISLNQIDAGGTYIQRQKIDGEWQEPVVGLNPKRTGGSWTDPATKADYEYEEDWSTYSDYDESTGDLSATDGYLYVDSIPSSDGWQGPSFVRTLPSYFRTDDFDTFSANLTLLHGNNGYRMTVTCVSLYDTEMQAVAVLRVYDSWGDITGSGDQRARFSAAYYLENGTYEHLTSSEDIYDDVTGIVRIRFDPHKGVFANIPGENETMLYKWTDVNPGRIIKYVAVQSYRYEDNDIHDARIYNVHVSYAASDYTVFHDSCNDMDEFHKDLDFGYGTVSDGNFTVPDGESYMTPTDIPNTPSGWHGPNYVHVLDRPFRLCQLSEFSVNGEMVQSTSSQMGQIRVALFDENKEIVMLILWTDSWVGSIKGYFNVYFYPQDSSSSSQGTGYIYTTFKKTGKLWWSSYPGNEGSIFSSIEGEDGFTNLGECDNASRVIKYVVLLGYRSGGYPLGDVRIHDINVVADLKWSNRDVTLIDPCNDVDNFESDPDFGWGVITDGNLTVPSGESYMTPSDIPNQPTGWHGPNHVYELETPFILHDLILFYVQAELIQHSARMGKMEVALFDTNKQCVLNIIWGDSWISSSKGYFHTVYYPEGGGSSGDGMGYIYTSFWRMGELKVEDGHMMYEISDQEEELASGDLGEIANPFRMIKYMVIRSSQSGAYQLIDIRLNNIGLYAGADTSVPEPEEADGSIQGESDYAYNKRPSSFDDAMDQAATFVQWFWTGPWPVLHFLIDFTDSSQEIGVSVEGTIDVIGTIGIEDVGFTIAGAEDMTESEADDFIETIQAEEAATDSWVWSLFVLGAVIGTMLWAAEMIAMGTLGLGISAVIGICGAAIILYLVFINAVRLGLRDSHLSDIDVLTAFAGFCLNAVLIWISASVVLSGLPLGIRKALNYFRGGYKASKPGAPGAIGRGNVVVFITTCLLILMTFIALGLVYNGW